MKSFINSNSFYPSGSAGIIELQNLKVFQIFEGYSVPLAKRLEKGYGYGFNGMERDDEIKGSGNSYDFGARIYDSRVGRWLSLDPLAKKYPSLSPYHGFANNPISVVDKDGKENIIYIVALPSSKEALGKIDFNDVAKSATKRLNDMGLKTEVRVYDPSSNGTFDPRNLDKRDSYALIGTVEEINNFIKNDNGSPKAGFDDRTGVNFAATGWKGGASHPEESVLGVYGNNRILGDNKLGQGILIDSKGIKDQSEGLGIDVEDGVVLTILHGAVHNAGRRGHKGQGLNLDGTNASIVIGGGGIDAIYKDDPNTINKAAIKSNFGDEPAEDNYKFNKKNRE